MVKKKLENIVKTAGRIQVLYLLTEMCMHALVIEDTHNV
jgi:hypothetical protein